MLARRRRVQARCILRDFTSIAVAKQPWRRACACSWASRRRATRPCASGACRRVMQFMVMRSTELHAGWRAGLAPERASRPLAPPVQVAAAPRRWDHCGAAAEGERERTGRAQRSRSRAAAAVALPAATSLVATARWAPRFTQPTPTLFLCSWVLIWAWSRPSAAALPPPWTALWCWAAAAPTCCVTATRCWSAWAASVGWLATSQLTARA